MNCEHVTAEEKTRFCRKAQALLDAFALEIIKWNDMLAKKEVKKQLMDAWDEYQGRGKS
jgi:hypothetical protein